MHLICFLYSRHFGRLSYFAFGDLAVSGFLSNDKRGRVIFVVDSGFSREKMEDLTMATRNLKSTHKKGPSGMS